MRGLSNRSSSNQKKGIFEIEFDHSWNYVSRFLSNHDFFNIEKMANYNSAIVKCGSSLLAELREEQVDFLTTTLNNPKKI